MAVLVRESGESEEAFRSRVLDALIDQQLQYEDAIRFGPEPPDAEEIEAAMTKVRERLRAEGKDPAAEFAAAGMTTDDVRASVERQLVVQRYLRERFRPGSAADEQRARAEYEERYVPERAGREARAPVRRGRRGDARARAGARLRRRDREVGQGAAREGEDRDLPAPVASDRPRAPVVLATAPAPTPTRPPAAPASGPDANRSARRPREGAAAQQMEVDVEDRLPGPLRRC